MKTIINTPPRITTYFNPLLLLNTIDRLKYRLENITIPLAYKKIKVGHVGRIKEFKFLIEQFWQVYEWQKTQEAEYKREVKEKLEKRPRLSNSSITCRFNRI